MHNRPTTQLDPAQQLRTIRIVWTALFLSPMVVMAVMHYVRAASNASREGSSPGPEMLVPLLAICCVMALMAPVAGRFVEAAQLRAAREQQPPPPTLTVLTMLTILRTAIGEGAALFAAVTYFLTGSPLTYPPFTFALLAMLWVRPTDERVDTIQRELGGHL
jgi:hypothetical protein